MVGLNVRWFKPEGLIHIEDAGWASISLAPFQRAVLIRKGRPWAVAPGRGGFMPKLFRAEKVAIVDIANQSIRVEIEGSLVTADGVELLGKALLNYRVRDDADSLMAWVGRTDLVLQKLSENFLEAAQEVVLRHDFWFAIGRGTELRGELTDAVSEKSVSQGLPFEAIAVASVEFKQVDEEIVRETQESIKLGQQARLSTLKQQQELARRAAEAEANLRLWAELVTRVGEVEDEFDKYLLAAFEPQLLPIVKIKAQQKIQELRAIAGYRAGAAEALLQYLGVTIPDRKEILLGELTEGDSELSSPSGPTGEDGKEE